MSLIDPKADTYRIMAADQEVVRVIQRMTEAMDDEKPTRQERRQWNKPAKKPKALRGRPMSDDDLIRRGDAMDAVSMDDPMTAIKIAAIPARGVGVKPLVWEPSVIGKPWHSAKAPWGWYYAQWDDETQAWFASLEMGEVEEPIIMSPSDVPTIDAAKAAAQDDYEARILASVHHVNETPKSEHDGADVLTAAQAREAALREAIECLQKSPAQNNADIGLALGNAHAIALLEAMIEAEPSTDAREAALSVLAGLSSYLGTGLGDDDTTPEQYDKRIRWAIDDLAARTRQAALREAAAVVEEEIRQAKQYFPQSVPILRGVSDRIIALIGEPRT